MSGPTATKSQEGKQQTRDERSSRERARHSDVSSLEADILALQQHAGNRAVNTLIHSAITPKIQTVLNSTGMPLDSNLRMQLESQFGEDFSDVRIHSNARAAESAQAVRAKAYTVGRNVVFGPSRYAPATGEGKRLLAHELAHAVQQSRPGNCGEAAAEADARQAADAVAHGGVAQIVTATPATIHRDPLSDAEIAKLDEAGLLARLRENDKEYRSFRPGIHPLEVQQALQRERNALSDALARIKKAKAEAEPKAYVLPPDEPPTYVLNMATDELFAERDRVNNEILKLPQDSTEHARLDAQARMLDKEVKHRRSVYESRLREGLPEKAKAMDAELAKEGRDDVRSPKDANFVDSLTIEGYGEPEFRIYAHGRTRHLRVAIFPTTEWHHWTISLGVINFVTGESKPESYVQHRGGAESEGLGPIEYILDAASVVGVVRALGKLALRPIIRGAGKAFTTAAERALAEKLAKDVGVPKGGLEVKPPTPKTVTAPKGEIAIDVKPPTPKPETVSGPKPTQPATPKPSAPAAPKTTPKSPADISGPSGEPAETPKVAETPKPQTPTTTTPATPKPAEGGTPKPTQATTPQQPSTGTPETASPKDTATAKPSEQTKPADVAGSEKPSEQPKTEKPAEPQKVEESGKPKPAAAEESVPTPQERAAPLEKQRAELEPQIKAKQKELGQKNGEVARLSGERIRARGKQREELDNKYRAAQAERDKVDAELRRLRRQDEALKKDIDFIKKPRPEDPRAAGRQFEAENVKYSGMPKNNGKHQTSFRSAEAPDGNRIPDYMPKPDGTGGWENAKTPQEAEFIAESKLLGKKLTLTQQLRGFIELAAKTKQKVLLLLTDSGAAIDTEVYDWAAREYGVSVHSMTRAARL